MAFHFRSTMGSTRTLLRSSRRRARRTGATDWFDHGHRSDIVPVEKSDIKAGATWAVGQISGAMKRLAKAYHCPVLLFGAPLNRGVKSRDDKRPVLSDLRRVGSIEQDADVVLSFYRAEYYLPKAPPEKGIRESAADCQTRIENYHHRRRRIWRGRQSPDPGQGPGRRLYHRAAHVPRPDYQLRGGQVDGPYP